MPRKSTGCFDVTLKMKGVGAVRQLPFQILKDNVLGVGYSLSLAFVSERESRRLNLVYRGKDRATDILSFPLARDAGEIIICPSVAKNLALDFGRSPHNFLQFLFIHGLLHLKGYRHGSRMEREESRIVKRFKV